MADKFPGRKGPWGSGQQLAVHELAVCLYVQGHWYPGLYQKQELTREWIFPLSPSALVRLYLEYSAQFLQAAPIEV